MSFVLYDKDGRPTAFFCTRGERKPKQKPVMKEETLKEKLKRVSKPKPFEMNCSYCGKDPNAMENYCECRND